MRSQLMLLVAVAAALIFLPSSRARADDKAISNVSGTGLYRSEQGCLRAIPFFDKRLAALGLRVTRPTECREVQGELDAYEPSFQAESDEPMVTETALAAPLQDEKSCRASLSALVSVVAEKDELIVESSCIPISVSDFEQGELITGQYQPMVILLKRLKPAQAPALARR
jgi:hypothetical protein